MQSRMKLNFVTAIVLVSLAAAATVGWAQQPKVGWEVDFGSPSDLASARIYAQDKDSNIVSGSNLEDVRVENGAMHLGMKFAPEIKHDQAWYVAVDFTGMGNMDVKKYPVLEIRHRLPKAFEASEAQPWPWLCWDYVDHSSKSGSSWLGFPCAAGDEWSVATFRIAPDSSVPGPLTPKNVTRIAVRIGSNARTEPVWYDVDYIRIRAFTPEEAAEEQHRVDLLANYVPPGIPERVRNVFFYGAFAEQSRLQGGWEGMFDALARNHFNILPRMFPDGYYLTKPGYIRDIANLAWKYGIYVVCSPGQGIPEHLDQPGGYASVEPRAKELAEEVNGAPNIVGWYIVDEPSKAEFWRTIGNKALLEKYAPQVIGAFPLCNLAVAEYYDRFSTVLWTDDYPLRSVGKRDPWHVGQWCKQASEASAKRHWFCPQAGGATDWWKRPGVSDDYGYPTLAEFRLMMSLSLANGVKGYFIWNYFGHGWDQWASMVDAVGNSTPLLEEAARIGAKWIAIGPMLLDARPVFQPQVTVTGASDAKHGISVGAMGDPAAGPVFMVATNESLERRQSGTASVPASWVARDRVVYDLYSLQTVSKAGASDFNLRALDPGDGRIYMLGTKEQYAAARDDILKNHLDETLRSQKADVLIAEHWGIDLSKYDAVVKQARVLAESGNYDKAVKMCNGQVARTLRHAMDSNQSLTKCRSGLEATRRDVGKTIRVVFSGLNVPRDGQKDNAEPCNSLCNKYGDTYRKYLLGQKDGLLGEVEALRADARGLLAKTSSTKH